MDTNKLFDLCIRAGFQMRDYSGRGMFGKKCVAVVTDHSVFRALAAIIENCADATDAAEIVKGAMTDDMGRNSILYWPKYAVPNDESVEDDEA